MVVTEKLQTIYKTEYRPSTNNAISKITSSYFFTYEEASVLDVADELNNQDDVHAIGVVDKDNRLSGIVEYDKIFSLLSKPYARDLLKKQRIKGIMREVLQFKASTNIFLVAEQIEDHLKKNKTYYYLLVDENDRFAGIFSSKDMMIFLSTITQRDIAMASNLQSRLVKEKQLLVGNGFEFFGSSVSAKGVGGDLYFAKKYHPHKWVFTLCDVSGKGVSAAIITSMITGMISIFDFSRGLEAFVQELNNFIFRTFETEKFLTGIFMLYDEKKNRLTICDMGHSYFYVYRKNKLLCPGNYRKNLPVGITEELDLQFNYLNPEKSDILLIFSDGIVDQENEQREKYPFRQLRHIFNKHCHDRVEDIGDTINRDFAKFKGPNQLTDDVTFCLIKFIDQSMIL